MTGKELEAIRQAWRFIEDRRLDAGIASRGWVLMAVDSHDRVPALLDEIERLKGSSEPFILWSEARPGVGMLQYRGRTLIVMEQDCPEADNTLGGVS